MPEEQIAELQEASEQLDEPQEGKEKNVYPSTDLIMQMCPNGDVTDVKKYIPMVFKMMAQEGMVSPNEIISILATIYTETLTMAPVEEIGAHGHYDTLPNGKSAHGRGFIQCTWLRNYRAFAEDTGVDVLNHPEKLIEDPVVSAQNLIWFFNGGPGPAFTELRGAAESGDFKNVRSIVNKGGVGKFNQTTPSGTKKFMGAVERGKKLIDKNLNPGDLGDVQMPSNYGKGDIDPGGGGSREIVKPNLGNQGSALMHALGIHARDRMHTHEARFDISIPQFPDILDLRAQQRFQIKDVDDAVDGEYVVQEIHFRYDRTPIAHVYATRPDANASAPQTFLHDANAGLKGNGEDSVSSPPASGDVNERIVQAAEKARGKDTSSGPDGGQNACAWSVNKFIITPILGQPLGKNSNYVPSVVRDIEGGKGTPVEPRSQAQPGDIAIMGNNQHIGIVLDSGGSNIISNSSSKASFSWETDWDGYDSWYDKPARAYRLKVEKQNNSSGSSNDGSN